MKLFRLKYGILALLAMMAIFASAKKKDNVEVPAPYAWTISNPLGLRYAAEKGYKYAMIANPDMEFPQEDYIQKLVTKMEQDDTIAVCASDIVNPDGRHLNPQREATYSEELFWFREIMRNRKSKKWYLCDSTQSGYCEKVSGCCLLLRMDFMQNIGFFDENVFLYSEESILAKQVKLSNRKSRSI